MKLISFLSCIAVVFSGSSASRAATSTQTIVVDTDPGQEAGNHVFVASNMETTEKKKLVTYLGVEIKEAPAALTSQLNVPEGQGLIVKFVQPDSPAAEAGFQQHDLLLKLDDQILVDPRQLAVLVRGHKDGDSVRLTYLRGGKETSTKVKLAQHEVIEHSVRLSHDGDNMQWFGDFDHTGSLAGNMSKLQDKLEHLEHNEVFKFAPKAEHGSTRVTIFSPNTNVILSDDEGTLELSTDGSSKTLRAKDKSGAIIFEGPVNTPEERKALPEGLLSRLEKLENIEVVQPPPPPPAPEAPMDQTAPRHQTTDNDSSDFHDEVTDLGGQRAGGDVRIRALTS